MNMVPFRNGREHLSEDELEEYAFGRFGEEEKGRVEEHLMLCEACREVLEDVESFIQGMKTAILEDREERAAQRKRGIRGWLWRGWHGRGWFSRGWFSQDPARRSNWIWGTALAALCLIAMILWPSPPLAPAPITLASFRGGETAATGPSGRPLDLAIDAAGIEGEMIEGDMRVEVVSVAGVPEWQGLPESHDGKLVAHVPKLLGSGSYWVRLYGKQELLREFGLRLE
jgi:predicted metal-binding protein